MGNIWWVALVWGTFNQWCDLDLAIFSLGVTHDIIKHTQLREIVLVAEINYWEFMLK